MQRLHELGWIGNRTVAIEYRWGEGRDERFSEIAAEFVRLKVDVILTYATPSSIAAKKATAIIPIAFAAAGDPVGTGPVASLVRPGGNITGLSQDRFAGSRFAKSQILKILEQCVFKHLLGFEWHVRSYHLQSD